MKFRSSVVLFFSVSVFSLGGVFAEDVFKEWTDANFVPCEGIGLHGSGRIKGAASISRTNHGVTVHTLSITSTHPLASWFSSSIDFKNQYGQEKSVTLTDPWYPTIGVPGNKTLVLPQNKTLPITGSKEQMEIIVDSSNTLTINANVVFKLDSGNCTASFSQSWRL